MKKIQLLFSLVAILFSLQGGFAQVYVDDNEDVGIGNSNTSLSRLYVYNTDATNTIGLRINHNPSISTGNVYGIYNQFSNASSASKYGFYNYVRQNNSSVNQVRGIFNDVRPYGTGPGYITVNYLRNYGTGQKVGHYNYLYQAPTATKLLYGTLTYLRNNGTNTTYGEYSIIYNNGIGAKTGHYNYVRQNPASNKELKSYYAYVYPDGSSTAYGFDNYVHANGLSHKYGIRNRVYQNSASISGTTVGIASATYLDGGGMGWGIHNYVYDAPTSSGTKYGIYNYLENDGSGTRYALWSGVKGGGDWAGYFSGNVYVTGTLTEAGSDARLKEKIKDLSGSLDILKQLAPKSYTFKKDMGIYLPEGQQYGIVAQDLEKILPTLVSEVQHPGQPIIEKKMVTETVSIAPEEDPSVVAEGSEEVDNEVLPIPLEKVVEKEEEVIVGYEEGQTFKTVNYKGLIPILVGAIKEQNNIVERQEARIDALQAELNAIKKQLKLTTGKK